MHTRKMSIQSPASSTLHRLIRSTRSDRPKMRIGQLLLAHPVKPRLTIDADEVEDAIQRCYHFADISRHVELQSPVGIV